MKSLIFVLFLVSAMYSPEIQPQSKERKIVGGEKQAVQAPREEKRERPTEVPDRKDRNINIPAPVPEPPVQTPPSYTPPADPTPRYEPDPVIYYPPEPDYEPVYDTEPPRHPGGNTPETPNITKRKSSFEIYTEQGIEYFDSGYYDKALIEFDNAILIDSTEYTLYYYRGCTLLKLDYFADAISDLNIYIMFFPGDKDALYNRGLAWFYMDNKSLAFEDFEAASTLGDKRAKAIIKRFY